MIIIIRVVLRLLAIFVCTVVIKPFRPLSKNKYVRTQKSTVLSRREAILCLTSQGIDTLVTSCH